MKAKTETPITSETPSATYFKLSRTNQNLFSVDKVQVVGDKVISTESSEPAYMPIAFDQLRRACVENFQSVLKENQ